MARNTITVTFTADAIATQDLVLAGLRQAAQEYNARQADVRDITVVSVEPAVEPVTVPPAILAAFREWQAAQQANVTA